MDRKQKLLIVIAILFILVIANPQTSFAQNTLPKETPKASLKAVGSLTVSYHPGAESVFLNFGGPGLRLEYGKYSISYLMFPSLRFFHGDMDENTNSYRTKSVVTPILGTGLQFSYKKAAVVFPMYYLPNNNVWIMSVGLGYKL